MYIVKRDGINLERMNENGETFLKYIQNIFWRFSCPLLSLPKPKGRDCKKRVFFSKLFPAIPSSDSASNTYAPTWSLPPLLGHPGPSTATSRSRRRSKGGRSRLCLASKSRPTRTGWLNLVCWRWSRDRFNYVDLTHEHLELWKVLMPPRRMESQQTSNK